jgi:protein required for attachment to host cells
MPKPIIPHDAFVFVGERLARERAAPALIIAAPPRTLADLRNALSPEVKARIVLETNKDFTKHPVWEIERHIVASLADQ